MSTARTPEIIQVAAAEDLRDVVTKLGAGGRSVLIVLGNFDPALGPQVQSIFTRCVLPITIDAQATILDDGRSEGCSAEIGQSVLEQVTPPSLVGVTASPQYDPNHRFIVQIQPEAEAKNWIFLLASAVANAEKTVRKPVMLMAVGGGAEEKLAIVRAARNGWPVVLIKGTGGAADAILSALQPATPGSPPPPIQDPILREIVETGTIYGFDIAGDVDELKRILSAQLQRSSEGLDSAWEWYDDLDKAAISKQLAFRTLQGWMLLLALLATLLAILTKTSLPWDHLGAATKAFAEAWGPAYRSTLKYTVILVPITVSVLTAINSRFRLGNKWVLLRAAAESIKREIFRYRVQACDYSDEQCTKSSRDSKLATKLKTITESLIQGEVNKTSIARVDQPNPARSTLLTPDQYIAERLNDQIVYYIKKTKTQNQQLQFMHVGILLAGAAGTFLAAISVAVWVALTTAFATALTAKLEIDQVENSLVQYNVALTSLRNIEAWWSSLSQWERGRHRNIDLLVDQTEKTLEGEMAGWVQQMQSTLDKLTEKEEKSAPQAQSATA